MTILELYTALQPIIDFLGTVCLIALAAGGILFVIVWTVKKLWKIILTFSAASVLLYIAVLLLNM